MNRDEMLRALNGALWDVIVIGGGATGLGVAVDAQTRGYRTLLLEQYDFSQGTSSRSTKLVHGGVRYLKQGNIALVTEALRERGLMRENAPHLVHDLAFVVPRYKWWEGPFYGIGLRLYDRLAGKLKLARSQKLDRDETIRRIPNIETEHLFGGTMYHDAQFDDARMAIALAQTAADHGATVLNYMQVKSLIRSGGMVSGVQAVDGETQEAYTIRGRVVIYATGIFADDVRQMDDETIEPMIVASQGIHLVLDRSFLQGDTAIMVPQTDDGRVLFVIPWYDRALVGTTDTEMARPEIEPRALDEEVAFLLRNSARYLSRDPELEDIRCIFAGQRPLVRPHGIKMRSKAISREHMVVIADSGLVTIIGGKWTTYRKMAQDTVDDAILIGGLEERPCVTEHLPLHGWMPEDALALPENEYMRIYGADAVHVRALLESDPTLTERLHPRLPYVAGQVVWAARHEMARTVEDTLSRRTRCLPLDAAASIEAAPRVAALLAQELGCDQAWAIDQETRYTKLARAYLPEKAQ